MSKVNSFVNEFTMKLKKRKIEGSKATAKLTAEVLRSFISQKRLPRTNQAGALIDAVNAVGEELIDANPVGTDKVGVIMHYDFKLTHLLRGWFPYHKLPSPEMTVEKRSSSSKFS